MRVVCVFLPLFVLLAGCSGRPSSAPTSGSSELSSQALLLPDGFDIQGHRGARALRPESTLPSYELALDLLVDTIEIDLHLSKDGRIVVWHDPFIESGKCGVPEDAEAQLLPDPDVLEAGDEQLMVRNLTTGQLGAYRCDRNPDPESFPQQRALPGPLAGDH